MKASPHSVTVLTDLLYVPTTWVIQVHTEKSAPYHYSTWMDWRACWLQIHTDFPPHRSDARQEIGGPVGVEGYHFLFHTTMRFGFLCPLPLCFFLLLCVSVSSVFSRRLTLSSRWDHRLSRALYAMGYREEGRGWGYWERAKEVWGKMCWKSYDH